jgi:hypothetical protein
MLKQENEFVYSQDTSSLIEFIESRFDEQVGLYNFVEANELEKFGFVPLIAANLASEIYECPVGLSTWDIICRYNTHHLVQNMILKL